MGDVTGLDDGFVASSTTELLGPVRRRPARLGELAEAVAGAGLATLVYTSGTTGPPKGTMITHANVMATMRSLTSLIDL